MTPEFIHYQQNILKNAKIMSEEIEKYGYRVVSG